VFLCWLSESIPQSAIVGAVSVHHQLCCHGIERVGDTARRQLPESGHRRQAEEDVAADRKPSFCISLLDDCRRRHHHP